MTPKRVELLVWLLIYGGMLAAGLGYFVQRTHDPIGWTLVGLGAAAAAAGVLLIRVRSTMKENDQ